MPILKRINSLLLTTLLFAGCAADRSADRSGFYVTIPPLRSIVQAIVEDDFPVEVLVPAGASPESFEPSARQFAALERAEMIFSVGLIDFETALLRKLDDPERIVDLSSGIALITGHVHHHDGHGHEHCHAHGVDPHIWTSPARLRTMADNAFRAIQRHYPDSVRYAANYARLQEQIDALDASVRERVAGSRLPYFLIYHPAMTYYAVDYGIEQVAIEDEGKEPSARRLAELISRARADGVRRVFYQHQLPVSVVNILAEDIGAEAVEIDPLREKLLENIDEITDLITQTASL